MTEEEEAAAFAREMPHRQCGECTACCTVMGAKTIGKPYYCDCEHQGAGCAIYNDRPLECQAYACMWWAAEFGGIPEEDRPDKLGLMFDVGPSDGLLWLNVFETRPGAGPTERGNAAISNAWKTAKVYGCHGIRMYPYGSKVAVGFKFSDRYTDEGDSGPDKRIPFRPLDSFTFMFAGETRKNMKPLPVVRA
jgi:hypothetical protein